MGKGHLKRTLKAKKGEDSVTESMKRTLTIKGGERSWEALIR
jgi:hypothetical protein